MPPWQKNIVRPSASLLAKGTQQEMGGKGLEANKLTGFLFFVACLVCWCFMLSGYRTHSNEGDIMMFFSSGHNYFDYRQRTADQLFKRLAQLAKEDQPVSGMPVHSYLGALLVTAIVTILLGSFQAAKALFVLSLTLAMVYLPRIHDRYGTSRAHNIEVEQLVKRYAALKEAEEMTLSRTKETSAAPCLDLPAQQSLG